MHLEFSMKHKDELRLQSIIALSVVLADVILKIAKNKYLLGMMIINEDAEKGVLQHSCVEW